jgi:hypothetical protein
VAIVEAAGYYAVTKVIFYNDAANSASIASIREMIFNAVDSLKAPAPVEAQTGNIYFPQARLYLPASKETLNQKLNYAYYLDDKSGGQLSVTNDVTMNLIKSRTYSSKDLEALFDQVPHLQACSRGISVSYKKVSQDESGAKLKQAVHLNNGKTVYLYLEDACPELKETVSQLKNLRAY